MKILSDLAYGTQPQQLLDIYLPDGPCHTFAVWFHGGSLKFGSRKDIQFHRELTSRGIGIASVEYRMYPQVNFPTFLTDSALAVRYLTDRLSQFTSAQQLYITGQSAGAWLTLMLAYDEHYLADAGVDRACIAGFISDSAQITSHFSVLRERGLDYRLERIDDAAPICFLQENSQVHNLLLISYEADMPCRPEQNRLFYASIRRLCPQTRVEMKILPGGHCAGSSGPNAAGGFDFADAMLAFIGQTHTP